MYNFKRLIALYKKIYSPVAQLVEQLAVKQGTEQRWLLKKISVNIQIGGSI